MDEYISREAAIVDFERCNHENPVWTPQRVKTLLMRIPTADVEPVVRCKDCRNSYEGIDGRICSFGPCVDCVVPDDYFCSLGERRDGDGA